MIYYSKSFKQDFINHNLKIKEEIVHQFLEVPYT